MFHLNSDGSIVRIADQASVPADPRNRDYQAYVLWLAAGNVPIRLPAPIVVQPLTADQLADVLMVKKVIAALDVAPAAVAVDVNLTNAAPVLTPVL